MKKSKLLEQIKNTARLYNPTELTVDSLSWAALSQPETRELIALNLLCDEDSLIKAPLPAESKASKNNNFTDVWPIEFFFSDFVFKDGKDSLEDMNIEDAPALIEKLLENRPKAAWFKGITAESPEKLHQQFLKVRERIDALYPFEKENASALIKQVETQMLRKIVSKENNVTPIFVFSKKREKHLIEAIAQELTYEMPLFIEETSAYYEELQEKLAVQKPSVLVFSYRYFNANACISENLLSFFEGSNSIQEAFLYDSIGNGRQHLLNNHIVILQIVLPYDFNPKTQVAYIGQSLITFAREQRLENIEVFSDMAMVMRLLNLSNEHNSFAYKDPLSSDYVVYLLEKHRAHYQKVFEDTSCRILDESTLQKLALLAILSHANSTFGELSDAMLLQLYDIRKMMNGSLNNDELPAYHLEEYAEINGLLSSSSMLKNAGLSIYKTWLRFRQNSRQLSFTLELDKEKKLLLLKNIFITQNNATVNEQFLLQSSDVDMSQVVGLDDAKQKLHMIKKYFTDPLPFKKLRTEPKMKLLFYGPPGCGKTMLAKAFSNDVDFPFYSLSAAEVTSQKFAGYGAILLRRIFETARQNAPAVIFLDELDALGNRNAFGNDSVGFDAKSILNSLLVMLDGIDKYENIIVLAATNRIEDLDPALLRPGRFGTKIKIEPLTLKQRDALIRNILCADECADDYESTVSMILSRTSGEFSPALTESIIHEAKLKAISIGKDKIDRTILNDVIDDIVLGKSVAPISKEVKVMKAYHEAAYAVAHHIFFPLQHIEKINIQNRSESFGATLLNESNNTEHYTDNDLISLMLIYLSCVAAEKKQFGRFSQSTGYDFEIAAKIGVMLAATYDMGNGIWSNINQSLYAMEAGENALPEELRNLVKRLTDMAYAKAEQIVAQHWACIERLATELAEHEHLEREQIQLVFANYDWYDQRTEILESFSNIREQIGFKRP